MVAKVGLEPTHPRAPHFECGVYTNFTTWPMEGSITKGNAKEKRGCMRITENLFK